MAGVDKSASVKVSKNARVGGTRTEKFIHDCSKVSDVRATGSITMIMVATGGKRRMEARCDRCGAVARRPSFMDLWHEPVVLKHIEAEG